MLIRRAPDLQSSEITSESHYLNRREWLAAAGILGVAALSPKFAGALGSGQQQPAPVGTPFGLQPDDKANSWEDVTGYNNFYEFGTGKEDPAQNARAFKARPWTVRVDGMVKKPADYQLEDFLKPHKVEDRIYRMRCVEAWSMVIPWRGIQLSEVLKKAEPSPQAKFVEMTTLFDPARMPGQRAPVLDWPYVGCVRKGPAQPEWRAAAARRPVEVRFQGREVDRAHPSRRQDAEEFLGDRESRRVRLLREREPRGRPPALEPGDGAAHRGVRAQEDADVQRVCRPGRIDVRGTGPAKELLSE
jgi:hypothetical protein